MQLLQDQGVHTGGTDTTDCCQRTLLLSVVHACNPMDNCGNDAEYHTCGHDHHCAQAACEFQHDEPAHFE